MAETYIHRFPPCPSYDMEGFESWLEAMAQKGFLLDQDPFFAGFATFRKGAPRAVRYRLQPKPKPGGLFAKRDPQQTAIDLAKECGWTYLGDHGDFFIFSADDPALPELDTDPQVQALALRELYRRKRADFISHAVLFLLYLGLMLWDGPVRYLLDQQAWFPPLVAVIWLVYSWLCLREFRPLKRLQTQLALGGSLSRRKDWQRGRWSHWGTALLSIPLVLLFLIGAFGNRFFDWEDSRWTARTEALPFATAADLYPGSAFAADEAWILDETDHVAARSTWLADHQIRLSQKGTILPDQADLYLRVEYFDLRAEWLAEALYDELLRAAQRSKYYEARTIADLAAEQEWAWQDVVSTCVLLREGDVVLLAELSQYDDSLPLDQWAAVFAQSILK